MRHRPSSRNPIVPVTHSTCRTRTAPDIRSSGAENCTIRPLRSAGAKLCHRPAFCSAAYPTCLRCNQRLMIDSKQKIRLDKLCLCSRCSNRQKRLSRENRRSFRNRPDVTGKTKGKQALQKCLIELALGP